MQKRILFASVLLALLFNFGWSAKTKQPMVKNPIEQKQEKQSPSTNFVDKKPEAIQSPRLTSPDAFDVPWLSVNAGGSVNMTSTNFGLKASVGQSVIGYATSTNHQMGIGFWYGAGGSACIAKPGDVNASGGIPNLQDVIYLVNFVFDKSRVAPPCDGTDPGNCWAFDPLCRGDVNGSGGVPNLQDVIYLVNFVFDKDRLNPPCNGTDPGNCWTPVLSGVCCLPVQ